MSLFSNVTDLQFRISNLTKIGSKKNFFCECSKIVGNLPGQDLYWSHFIKVKGFLSRIYILPKVILYIFQGIFAKVMFKMFRNILRKTNSSCPVYHLQLYWKRTPTQRFLVSNSIIFKIAGKHLWWNYLLVKDQKEFVDSTILSITLSRRLCFNKQLFQKSCRPTAYSCSFSKSELLANRNIGKCSGKAL